MGQRAVRFIFCVCCGVADVAANARRRRGLPQQSPPEQLRKHGKSMQPMPMMLVLYVPPLLLQPLAPASGGDAAAACGGSGVSHAAVAHEARLRCGCTPQKRRETDEGGNRSVNGCGMLRGGRWWRGCRRSCRSAFKRRAAAQEARSAGGGCITTPPVQRLADTDVAEGTGAIRWQQRARRRRRAQRGERRRRGQGSSGRRLTLPLAAKGIADSCYFKLI